MSGVHGMIVAATDASLLLFRPADDALDDSNVHSHSWLFDHAIDVEESTASLSWSPNELLAAGGKCLSVWNLAKTDYDMDLKVVWRLRSPFRVQRVEFGPDGKFFFSLAEGDRHLKLWFPSVKDPGRFDFLYLRHPCVVANAEWRRPRSRNEISSNVLLTTGDDGVSRIWCQNGKVFPHQFEMRAIIDPPLDTMQEEETRRSRINQPIRGAFLGDSPQYIDVPILHWLPGAEIEAAIDYTEVKEDTFVKKKRKSATSLRRSKRLRDVMKDYPDMLFWIGFDGSITIWGIQFLNGSPRRVPKVLVVLKNNAAVLPVDYDMFRGAVQIYHDNRSLDRASIYFPAELQVLAMAPSGLLGSYRMNLEDFFGSTWANSYLKLEHFWPGHRSTVARFFRHPRLPYIGTSSEDGEINFYRFEAPQKSIRSKEGLDLLSKLDSVAHEQQKFLSWLPDRPCAIVASNDEIYLDELNLSGAKRLATLSLNSDSACFAVATFALCSEAAEAASKYWAYIIRPRLRSVVLLEISFIGLSFQSSEVLKTFEVEELRPDVVEIAPLDEWTSRFGPGIEGGPHQFVSQSKDGYVDVWSLCDVAGFLPSKFTPDLVWKRTMATKIESTKALVKSDCSGDFVLASSKGSDSVEIFIYTPGSIRFKSGPFAKVTASSDIVDMAIHLSSDAQVFLAVSTHAGVDVYCFDRITESGTSLTLRRVSESVTGWDSKIYKICWLFDGSLALALEDKVVVMSKWLSDRPIPLGSVPNSIHSCVVKHNGRLPEYHPFLLTHYLVWGKYDRVKYFLSFLHKYVRLMRSNDRAVDQVPSVLWQFFEDANTANRSSAAPNYDSLFTVGDEDHIPEAPIGDFTIVELTSLTDALATMRLPWLSEEDQLKLLAIMDTFVQIEPERRSLDDNGVRFVLFAKLFIFARKFGKADDIPSTVSFRDVAWAFYSDSQEHLVDFLSEVSNGKPTWTDAKSLGMGFWLKNVETLRKQVETFARNQYMGKEDRDPVDCSLFYITLKKKNVLLGLWKLATNHPEQGAMVKFLGNDFAEERWQKAAVKNAFALLGKQRYEYAAAFFLLGERLKDAASVCLKQLNDPQLAIVLCRLVEGDESPILKDIVENSLLSDALREGNRWLASICFSFLGDKSNSVYATYLPLSSLRGEPSIDSGEVCQEPPFDPSIFLLYEHLHKYYRAMRAKIPPASAVIQREFICDAVQTYDSMGCPTLSLEISADFFEAARAALGEETQAKPLIQAEASTQSLSSNQKAEDFDWSTPVSGKAQEVDWSAPVSQKAQDFDWGPPASSVSQKPEDFDWSAPVSSQPSGNSAGIDWGEPVGSNSFDDDYGKFKKSLFANTAEDEDLVDEDVMVEEAEERETISPSDGARESELAVDPVARLSYELSIRCMRRLRWLLVFRIIHVIDQSAACISKNLDVLSPEETFKNYFTLVGSGLQELCRFADMKPELLEHLIIRY
ncbi:RAVE protein 1 C terminal-domain-containing protein [Zopfochytrium polystomum]|nr:RAVE protein 1 C terminal-domain-containing protein [Zopfochytrium polystomum]